MSRSIYLSDSIRLFPRLVQLLLVLGGLAGCSGGDYPQEPIHPNPTSAHLAQGNGGTNPHSGSKNLGSHPSEEVKPDRLASYQEQLEALLKKAVYTDTEVEPFDKWVHVDQGTFTIDEHDGSVLFQSLGGLKQLFNIAFVKDVGVTLEPQAYGGYSIKLPTPVEKDALLLQQRSRGTFLFKTQNSDCYFGTAQKHLRGGDVFERLLAMERDDHPRPLMFTDDAQWNEFKNDIVSVFKAPFPKGGHILVLGSSTTFISQNPTKGKNAALLEVSPSCRVADIPTYDSLGKEPSDLDINLFIPELSELCNKSAIFGNEKLRVVYAENGFEKCVWESHDDHVKALFLTEDAKPYDPQTNSQQPVTLHSNTGNAEQYKHVRDISGKPQTSLRENKLFYTSNGSLRAFMLKWADKLKDHAGHPRHINISVRILPHQLKNPKHPRRKYATPMHDFSHDPSLKNRFIIDLN